MTLYTLNPTHEPSLWAGPNRPTQAQIDEVLVEHFRGRARVTVLELRCNGGLVGMVAHDDYDGGEPDPSELGAVENN